MCKNHQNCLKHEISETTKTALAPLPNLAHPVYISSAVAKIRRLGLGESCLELIFWLEVVECRHMP